MRERYRDRERGTHTYRQRHTRAHAHARTRAHTGTQTCNRTHTEREELERHRKPPHTQHQWDSCLVEQGLTLLLLKPNCLVSFCLTWSLTWTCFSFFFCCIASCCCCCGVSVIRPGDGSTGRPCVHACTSVCVHVHRTPHTRTRMRNGRVCTRACITTRHRRPKAYRQPGTQACRHAGIDAVRHAGS